MEIFMTAQVSLDLLLKYGSLIWISYIYNYVSKFSEINDITWMVDFSRLDVVLISETWPTELGFQITN